jgi:hypothetical protein
VISPPNPASGGGGPWSTVGVAPRSRHAARAAEGLLATWARKEDDTAGSASSRPTTIVDPEGAEEGEDEDEVTAAAEDDDDEGVRT